MRKLVLGVLAFAFVGGLIWLGGRALLPHSYTAKELLAMPEGQLLYPDATVEEELLQDQKAPGIEPGQPARVLREFAFGGSPSDVMPWYRSQLELRGWSDAGRNSGLYQWRKDPFLFQLAVCGDGGDSSIGRPYPCNAHAVTMLWGPGG